MCSHAFSRGHTCELTVGDGLQNERSIVPTETKVKLIQKLVKAGCSHIETASFVSPKKVPAMADAKAVMAQLNDWRLSNNDHADCTFSVLTPNLRGMEDALRIGGMDEVAIFASSSEAFSERNIGCSIEESFTRFQSVMDMAKEWNVPVRGYVSCVLGCPYEGKVDTSQVAKVAEKLLQMGCHEISLGDTIGVGTPTATKYLLQDVKLAVPTEQLAVHFHDTYGQALANIYVSLNEGVRTVDSSVAGLGGCPYAKGASGNVATEDVVYMLNGMGLSTGIDLDLLADAGQFITHEIGRESNSKCGKALAAKAETVEETRQVCL